MGPKKSDGGAAILNTIYTLDMYIEQSMETETLLENCATLGLGYLHEFALEPENVGRPKFIGRIVWSDRIGWIRVIEGMVAPLRRFGP